MSSSDLAVLAFQLFFGVIAWGIFVGIGGFVLFSLITRSIPTILFSLFTFCYVMVSILIPVAGSHGGHLEVWIAGMQILLVKVITEGPLTFHVLGFGVTNLCIGECKNFSPMMGLPLILQGADLLLYFCFTGVTYIWATLEDPAWDFSRQLNHAACEQKDREKFGLQWPYSWEHQPA